MEQALRDVSQMAFSLVVSLAPVVALVVLLNRRDRRERALFADACGAFSSQALRSDVAIRVRCGLVSRRALVTVDMPLWSRDELWDCLTRLRRRLPPWAHLRLDGAVEPALRTRLTVERLDAGGELILRVTS